MTAPVMTEFSLTKVRPRFFWGGWGWWPIRFELTVVWRALNGRHGSTHKLCVGDKLEISNPNMIIDLTPCDCSCDLCAERMRGRLKL